MLGKGHEDGLMSPDRFKYGIMRDYPPQFGSTALSESKVGAHTLILATCIHTVHTYAYTQMNTHKRTPYTLMH